MPRPIAVDLFAGAGGMTLGFEEAGFDVLAAVEIDPIHCAAHEYNFPHCTVFCGDISQISGQAIRDNSPIKNQPIDVIFGGPPCQGFSLIGKRSLEDPRNALVFHFIRLVRELQPKYFVIENVKGMAIGKHQNFIAEVIDKFDSCGYEVEPQYRVLDAAFYGVPQKRERLFLLGSDRDLPLPNYPEPITYPPNKKRLKKYQHLPETPTVWDAIADLPKIENYPQLRDRDWVRAKLGAPSPYAAILRGEIVPDDDFSYRRNCDRALLTCSLRTAHTQKSIARFRNTLPGKTEPVSRFRKLDKQGLCNTLRAGTPTSRGAFTSPRPIHPELPRCITVREAARLHSYPDWFRFHGTKWHGFRQVGNSVPPLLAKAIAAEIIQRLGVSPVKPDCTINCGNDRLLYFDMTAAAAYYKVDRHIIKPRRRGLGSRELGD